MPWMQRCGSWPNHPGWLVAVEDVDRVATDLERAVEDSLDRAAEQRITEIDVLESFLHDDIAAFIYDRLKRRPMVLPVVVEV